MVRVAPSDIYPALRRFLLESGLQKTLRALDKETSAGEDEEVDAAKSKKAAALAELELTVACQLWLDTRCNGAAPTNGAAAEAPGVQDGAKAKRKKREAEAEAEAEAEQPTPAVEDGAKGKRKRREAEAEAEAEQPAPAVEAAATEEPPKKKKKSKEAKEEKPAGTPFKRIDEEKWKSALKDERLLDNRHTAKQKFGDSAGDSWADKASEDLLKVKGKGFRKEMAKKKRASWRGGGEIDQGVNSIKFDDSSDEE